jgi:hypothetical protein
MKKILFSFLISIALFSGELKAQNVLDDSVFVYFLKNVVIGNMIIDEHKSLVVIPFFGKLQNLPSDYFIIAEKYYPGTTRDSLIKKINKGLIFNQNLKIEGYNIYIPEESEYYKFEHAISIFNSPTRPIIRISPTLFSPDGNTCILFAYIVDSSGFTVEITKNSDGKWGSHKKTYHFIQ